ncbi:helix-turn-helix domain-containing protein, partial [Streptomyces lutosisoli]
MPPARRRFVTELRSCVQDSGLTSGDVAARMGMHQSSISRALNGGRTLSEEQVRDISAVLGLSDSRAKTLMFLWQQARSETQPGAARRPAAASEDLADRLSALRQESGLSLREIAARLASTGTPAGKSTVERVLREPGESPLLALQMAGVLIDALPEAQRGPAAAEVFSAVLTGTQASPLHLTLSTGSGKTTAALQTLYSYASVPSAVTVASLARKLDLPVRELRTLRRAARAVAGRDEDQAPGRLISEWNPLELEVHPSAPPSRPGQGELTELPAYIPRAHDQRLAETVREASEGHSRMTLLVGTPSTGKTRACWEAVQPLAAQGWRLWHPFNPTRAEAALEGLDHVQPRTVVWLNEAQHYFADPRLGERVAAGVRKLLNQPERGPVLILGTLWPAYAEQLTAPPSPGTPDPHSQVRALLTGRTIATPDTFDQEAMESATALATADPRLAEALEQSGRNGRITQELAGAPDLLRRYVNSASATRAVLHAAMDACRLGVGSPLPQDFLTTAAIGYLTDDDVDHLTEDWAERAFAELARPVHGGLAPLRRIRPGPGVRPSTNLLSGTAHVPATGPVFRLADYLQRHGALTRQILCPPASFWQAADSHLRNPEDLYGLASAAYDRYRIQWAHRLRDRTADAGESRALLRLVQMREQAGDRASAEVLAEQAADAGDTFALT